MFIIRKVRGLIEKFPAPLKNLYLVSIMIFSIWMIFFDKHSLITHIKLTQIINNIHHDMDNYREQIEIIATEKELMDLKTERYVREKYFMSRENEDVFIIVRD